MDCFPGSNIPFPHSTPRPITPLTPLVFAVPSLPPWRRLWPIKVTGIIAVRQIAYSVPYYKWSQSRILYHFADVVRYWSKIAVFSNPHPGVYLAPRWRDPIGILPESLTWENRVPALHSAMIACWWIQANVTDTGPLGPVHTDSGAASGADTREHERIRVDTQHSPTLRSTPQRHKTAPGANFFPDAICVSSE